MGGGSVALTVITEQPNSTPSIGAGWTVTGGGGVASAALADGLDTSFVSLSARAQLDSQILRLGFAVPAPPAGAKVYSVGVRIRYQKVAAGSLPPNLVLWLRSVDPPVSGSTARTTTVQKTQFFAMCPISADTTTPFQTLGVGTFFIAPDGAGWDPTTNLSAFTLDIGRVDDYGNALVISEVFLDITYQQQSTVTVTGPSGTVASTRPAVTWSYSSPDSQPQQAFQTALYSQAQTLVGGFVPFQSVSLQSSAGWVLGSDLQWQLPNDIVDGTYVVYVRVKTKWGGPGDFISPAASGTFTRSASSGGAGTFPPNATLSSVVFDSVNNRVAVTMVPSSSSVVTSLFTVLASRDNGVSWAPIPSLSYVAANGMTPVTGYDYAAPIGVASQYQVLAYGPSSSAPVGAAAYSSVVSVTTSGITQPWLKDPQNSLNNTPISMFAKGNKSSRRRVQGTFEPLSGSGNVFPFVVNGPVYGESGTLVLMYTWQQQALYQAWTQLDTSGHVLLFQRTDGTQIWVTVGPGAAGQDTQWEYESIDPSGNLYQKVTLSFTQVNAPSFF